MDQDWLHAKKATAPNARIQRLPYYLASILSASAKKENACNESSCTTTNIHVGGAGMAGQPLALQYTREIPHDFGVQTIPFRNLRIQVATETEQKRPCDHRKTC
ncbi:unnamed protein product [Ectocarpus sp. 12 AP-2014]